VFVPYFGKGPVYTLPFLFYHAYFALRLGANAKPNNANAPNISTLLTPTGLFDEGG
jgi:hypothetical protein